VETVLRQDGPHDALKIDRWGCRRRLLPKELPEESTEQNDESR
jgi:hypothetical protein